MVDLGCGRADFGLAAIRASRARLIGIDFSAAALQSARARAEELGRCRRSSPSRLDSGGGLVLDDCRRFGPRRRPAMAAIRDEAVELLPLASVLKRLLVVARTHG